VAFAKRSTPHKLQICNLGILHLHMADFDV